MHAINKIRLALLVGFTVIALYVGFILARFSFGLSISMFFPTIFFAMAMMFVEMYGRARVVTSVFMWLFTSRWLTSTLYVGLMIRFFMIEDVTAFRITATVFLIELLKIAIIMGNTVTRIFILLMRLGLVFSFFMLKDFTVMGIALTVILLDEIYIYFFRAKHEARSASAKIDEEVAKEATAKLYSWVCMGCGASNKNVPNRTCEYCGKTMS